MSLNGLLEVSGPLPFPAPSPKAVVIGPGEVKRLLLELLQMMSIVAHAPTYYIKEPHVMLDCSIQAWAIELLPRLKKMIEAAP